MRAVFALAACLLFVPRVSAQTTDTPQDTLTLYRCVGSDGVASLQDAPCAKGQTQQVRSVTRPRDPPPRPVAPAPTPTPAAPAPPERVVYRTPPRPLYECLSPDGERYLSDDGRGNPRWVPQWTQGYPSLLPRPHPQPRPYPPVQPLQAGVSARAGAVTVTGSIRSSGALYPPPVYASPLAVAGSWVRDDCAQLPPMETCARLRDRRAALRTRFFNAQEKERDVLRREERTLNARLDNDCGGR